MHGNENLKNGNIWPGGCEHETKVSLLQLSDLFISCLPCEKKVVHSSDITFRTVRSAWAALSFTFEKDDFILFVALRCGPTDFSSWVDRAASAAVLSGSAKTFLFIYFEILYVYVMKSESD